MCKKTCKDLYKTCLTDVTHTAVIVGMLWLQVGSKQSQITQNFMDTNAFLFFFEQ
jgi:hypothetical protein